MRVLMRDREDDTLLVVEAISVCYDKDAQELVIDTAEDQYVVGRIVPANADSVLRELYNSGKTDLTEYLV